MPRKKSSKKRKVSAKSVSNALVRASRDVQLPPGVRRGYVNEASEAAFGPSLQYAKMMAMTGKPEQLMNRLRYKWYGAGDYTDVMKNIWGGRKYIPRGLGALYGGITGAAGAVEGGYPGMALGAIKGASSGWSSGAGLSKALGWGDYSVNQIVSSGEVGMNPQQSVHHVSTVDSDLSGDIVYSNSEFIQNIYANVTGGVPSSFQVSSFPLNCGMGKTFPFLSQIANNFELYEFVGLMFQYKPTSGNFGSSNSNALGKVVLATNYDPDAPDFVSTLQMENYDYACSTKPSEGCIHGVECSPSQRSTMLLYTRNGTVSKNKVFTDLGNFQIATEGIPGTGTQEVLIGELWVTYTIKLSRAKIHGLLGQSIPYTNAKLTSVGATFVGATTTYNSNTLGAVVAGTGVQTWTITFPRNSPNQLYWVVHYTDTTYATNIDIMPTIFANCSEPVLSFRVRDGVVKGMTESLIKINNTNSEAVVTFSVSANPTGAGEIMFCSISQVDPDFLFSF